MLRRPRWQPTPCRKVPVNALRRKTALLLAAPALAGSLMLTTATAAYADTSASITGVSLNTGSSINVSGTYACDDYATSVSVIIENTTNDDQLFGTTKYEVPLCNGQNQSFKVVANQRSSAVSFKRGDTVLVTVYLPDVKGNALVRQSDFFTL